MQSIMLNPIRALALCLLEEVQNSNRNILVKSKTDYGNRLSIFLEKQICSPWQH